MAQGFFVWCSTNESLVVLRSGERCVVDDADSKMYPNKDEYHNNRNTDNIVFWDYSSHVYIMQTNQF